MRMCFQKEKTVSDGLKNISCIVKQGGSEVDTPSCEDHSPAVGRKYPPGPQSRRRVSFSPRAYHVPAIMLPALHASQCGHGLRWLPGIALGGGAGRRYSIFRSLP